MNQKKSIIKRWYFWVITGICSIIIIFLSVTFLSIVADVLKNQTNNIDTFNLSSSTDNTDSKGKEYEFEEGLTYISKLKDDFEENRLKATNTYSGKTITTKGIFKDIEKEVDDSVRITLTDLYDESSKFYCNFSNSSDDMLKLKAGDEVKIKGVMQFIESGYYLVSSEIVE